ncbi:MAG: hypothetical protein U5K37_06195 [Natrialbaceae archaeon]|nr:hypothetical protein [Natrialbaceae archaeon]
MKSGRVPSVGWSFSSDRGQSTLVGALLLLGILMVALASYQLAVVPEQNAAVEHAHHQGVQSDLHRLRAAMLTTQTTDSHRSAVLDMGTGYPARIVGINPPPSSGTLRTSQPSVPIDVDNAAVARGTFVGDTDELFFPQQTRFLSYTPDYAEYTQAPSTHFEHGLLYHRAGNATAGLSPDGVFAGSQIRLTVLTGNLSISTVRSVSIDPTIVSGPTAPVPIESDGAGPITITLPTDARHSGATDSVAPTMRV